MFINKKFLKNKNSINFNFSWLERIIIYLLIHSPRISRATYKLQILKDLLSNSIDIYLPMMIKIELNLKKKGWLII